MTTVRSISVAGDVESADTTLPSPGLYQTKVCAIAPSGLTAPEACAVSDGIFYDTSPPLSGEVCVGWGAQEHCGAGVAYESTEVVSIHWHGFSDGQTGVASFQVALGSSPGGDDVMGWKDVGLAASTELPPLATSAESRHATVKCVNNAGLATNASLTLLIDATPPSFAPAWGGGSTVQFVTTSPVTITVSPAASVDPESPVISLTLTVAAPSGELLFEESLDAAATDPQVDTFHSSGQIAPLSRAQLSRVSHMSPTDLPFVSGQRSSHVIR